MSKFIEWRGHQWIGLVVRLYLGGVFLAACYHKILYPVSFAVDVATYEMLPLWAINLFALALPWAELAAGMMLVLGLRVRAAALMTTGMMVMFMLGLGWALYQGLDMSCGCFASQSAAEDDPISWNTMLRDSVWLLQSVYILVFDRDAIGVERWLLARRNRHA